MFYVYYLMVEGEERPFYVGKSFVGSKRLAEHFSDARKRNTKSIKCNYINKAWSEGKSVYEKIVATTDTEKEAFAIEKTLIEYWGRRNTNTGILANLTDGGEGECGKVFSEETRAKMSAAKIGHRINLGRKRPDTVARLSKPVTVFDADGNNLGSYESQKEAAERFEIDKKFINACLRPSRPYKSSRSKTGQVLQFRYGIIEGNINAIEYRKHRSPAEIEGDRF